MAPIVAVLSAVLPACDAGRVTREAGAPPDLPGDRDSDSAIVDGGQETTPGGIGRWVPLPTVGAPRARASHSAVWTGSALIVWGGQEGPPGSFALGDGAILDFARGTWAALPRPPGIWPRMDHIAFWIPPRMWIWGGATDEGDTAIGEQGADYAPATNLWTIAGDSQGRPQGRDIPAAVWTGTRVIVWGGGSQFAPGYLGDGGICDPSSGEWTLMSGDGAPGPRYAGAAVWTGTRFLVWGGSGDPTAPLSGGSYDPAADRWYPISTIGAPEVAFPVGVYTGHELVVWGQSPLRGMRTSGQLMVGGAYDPERDTWRPINIAGGPTSRAFASGVWTGRFFILWGGRTPDGQNLGDGARYDPADDSWVALPMEGAPDGRIRHTAVWTGDAMLIWGGMGTDGAARADGAAYLP